MGRGFIAERRSKKNQEEAGEGVKQSHKSNKSIFGHLTFFVNKFSQTKRTKIAIQQHQKQLQHFKQLTISDHFVVLYEWD